MEDDCTLSSCDFNLSLAHPAWPNLTLPTMGVAAILSPYQTQQSPSQ